MPVSAPAACSALALMLAFTQPAPLLAQDSALAPDAEPAAAAQAEPASPWAVTLGAGVGIGPDYVGADGLAIGPLPILEVSYDDRVFLGTTQGLGVVVWRGEETRATLSVEPGFGRDEDDADRLEGLGDLEAGAAVTAALSQALGSVELSAALTQEIGGGEGLTLDLGIASGVPLSESVTLTGSLGATLADQQHLESYFGVDRQQARRSGLKEFEPEAGLKSVTAGVGLGWQATEQWRVDVQAGVSVLTGDAADSPVTEESPQPFAGVTAAYSF